MKTLSIFGSALAVVLFIPACSSSDSADDPGGAGAGTGGTSQTGGQGGSAAGAAGAGATAGTAGMGGSVTGGSGGGQPVGDYIGAPGVHINQIAIYQGIKRTLVANGAPADSDVPMIAGRDALIRVFYTTDAAYDGSEVLSRLTVGQGEPIEAKGVLKAESTDPDFTSTVYFKVPGDRIGDTLDYSVELLQQGDASQDNSDARYPAQGIESVPVEGPVNTLRIILAPFRYDYDGSGRVPNLEPDRVEIFKERFMGMYPISNVEISVREPHPWNQAINKDGSGWQQVGFEVVGFRSTDGTPEDVYYYGIFNPAESLMSYCGNGCLLGVTLLNDSPADVGNPMLRLALGVGFESVAADTCAHEVGHAHGRRHAPCGAGVSDIDPAYPYDGGKIGVWGYDIVHNTLRDPDVYTDIMGYCNTQWISDYHFNLLLYRGKHVNLPYWYTPSVDSAMSEAVEYDVIAVDGDGNTTWRDTPVRNTTKLAGKNVEVTLMGHKGQATAVSGHYYHYDHIPGGWLFVPATKTKTVRAEFVVDNRFTVAAR